MGSKLILMFLLFAGVSLNADVIRWVDSEGHTHYSNKAPKTYKKSSKKIKFSHYKKPEKREIVVVPAVDWAQDVAKSQHSEQSKVSKKKPKPKQATITELRAQCDIAREKRLAPARAEAIEACIEKNEAYTKDVSAYCERFNRTFGDEPTGGVYVGSHGIYRRFLGASSQRLFHNIPECRRLYRAEDKRSRVNRGYRD